MTNAKTSASRASRIQTRLETQFAPAEILLSDESAKHDGHDGAQPGGETHYRLRLVAAAFAGLSRVARQRLVNEALADEFAGGLHALSMELKAPGEN